VAALAWLLLGALTWWWPNKEIGFSDWAYTTSLPPLWLRWLRCWPRARRAERCRCAGWCLADRCAALLAVWEVLTAKLGVLPPPFLRRKACWRCTWTTPPGWACRWRIRCGCWCTAS
jgi:NitT/TauT family transport system permease protein